MISAARVNPALKRSKSSSGWPDPREARLASLSVATKLVAPRIHEELSTPLALPFRIRTSELGERLAEFNCRREIQWFGFSGQYEAPSSAVICLSQVEGGMLGGGGIDALNGGIIAAGFDAVCVLAAIAQFGACNVVTLNLQVQFMRLASLRPRHQFRAQVLKCGRHICFVQAVLVTEDKDDSVPIVLATATATLAPR
jgi:acyl-coenzyme A thioesterase PaaI-like protein